MSTYRFSKCAVAGASAMVLGAAGLVGMRPAAAETSPGPISFSIRSFDGTTITGTYFRAPGATKAPTILKGPGWGGGALTDPAEPTSTGGGTVGIGPLLANGYNVVSWNPRGFHTSTGRAEADSLLFEARDASAIITWVAKQPWAQLDRPGDPRMGMVGGSYGGAIQWATAAIDRRVDAIAPDISWNSLVTSLYPNRTAKSGWAGSLLQTAQASGQRDDPRIDTAFSNAVKSVHLTRQDVSFLGSWQRNNLASLVRTPALIVQGTADTLFPLDEAAANYQQLQRNRVPVKMIWFCGGHGVCLTNPGDTGVIQRETLAWLAKYVKRQHVSTGAGFQWVDQQGVWHSAARYRPNTVAGGVRAAGAGTLSLTSAGGSGPYAGPGSGDLGPGLDSLIATKATNAVNVTTQFRTATTVLGAPVVTLTYSGRAPQQDGRILAQVVDNATGVVLGSQLTPIPVRLDGRTHRVSIPLEYVAATAARGSTFIVQLVADSSQIDTHPTGGSVHFPSVTVSLPTTARR